MRFDSAELGVGLLLAALGDEEALGGEQRVADHAAASRGSMSCSHMPLADHQREVRARSARRTRRARRPRRAGLQPRQQRDQVGARPAGTAAARPRRPSVGATKKCSCRIDETECASVSTGAIAGDTGVTEAVPSPAAVGADQHDLVAVLVGRDLAACRRRRTSRPGTPAGRRGPCRSRCTSAAAGRCGCAACRATRPRRGSP